MAGFSRFGWEQTEDNNPVVSSKAEIIHGHMKTTEKAQSKLWVTKNSYVFMSMELLQKCKEL